MDRRTSFLRRTHWSWFGRAWRWLDRKFDYVDLAIELIESPLAHQLLLVFVLIALPVLFGLVVLGGQVFLLVKTGLWTKVPVAAAFVYLGIDLSSVYHPQEWKVVANIAAWVLGLPLWSVALWPLVGLLILAIDALPEFCKAFFRGATGRDVFDYGSVHSYQHDAERGVAWAQNNLAFLYEKGWGVPQDFIRSFMWYSIAAATHPPGKSCYESARSRDRLAKRMTPDQVSEAQRMAREWLEQHPARGAP